MTRNNKKIFNNPINLLSLFGFVIVFFACYKIYKNNTIFTDQSQQQLTVVCTTNILADTISNILPPTINVISLMGFGIDPHLYRATAGDLNRLSCATLIIHNGLHLEGKMSTMLENLADKQPVIAATDCLKPEQLLITDRANMYDPHVWHDVQLWQTITLWLGQSCARYFPDHAATILQKTQIYACALQTLDTWIIEQLAQLQPTEKYLVTAHDAFRYFGARYNINIIGLQGVSTDAQLSLHDIHKTTELMIEKKIKKIFAETSVSNKGIYAVQQATRAQGWNISIGQELYSDSLGAQPPTNTYIGMIQYNIITMFAS